MPFVLRLSFGSVVPTPIQAHAALAFIECPPSALKHEPQESVLIPCTRRFPTQPKPARCICRWIISRAAPLPSLPISSFPRLSSARPRLPATAVDLPPAAVAAAVAAAAGLLRR
jgi:hypothetical protein